MIFSGKSSRITFHIVLLKFLFILISAELVGENPAEVRDSSENKDRTKGHSLFAGAGYGTNMIYLGSTISRNQPYGYGSLSYGLNDEFFVSFSSVHLAGLDPFLSFHIGSLTYNHVFNSWFDISAGCYRYQVAPSLTEKLFSNFTYGDLTLGFDWRLIYTKIAAGALFSEENQAYFQLRNSRYFKTPDFLKGKLNVSFDPYVNLLFGTLIESRTSTETIITISTPSRKWRRYRYLTTTYSKKFGLMEADLGIPVALNGERFTIEAEPSYLLPVHNDPDFPGSKGFIFMVSAYFRFF